MNINHTKSTDLSSQDHAAQVSSPATVQNPTAIDNDTSSKLSSIKTLFPIDPYKTTLPLKVGLYEPTTSNHKDTATHRDFVDLIPGCR